MPTLTQMRTNVDTWLANRWPTVVARQQAFFAQHGRYWQGLVTHSTFPVYTNSDDGASSPDRFEDRPTDELVTWSALFPELVATLFPASLCIDAYHGPQGHGWVAIVIASHNGIYWRRSRGVGPDTHLDSPWTAVALVR